MPTPVWTYPPANDGFDIDEQLDFILHEMGDGYYTTAIKSQAWSHQDGTGGADTSHLGYNIFEWELPVFQYGGNYTAPLDFLRARRAAGFESFYIYDPLVEPNTANWNGTNTAGRHLVKHFGPIPRSGKSYQLAKFRRLKFHEVRS